MRENQPREARPDLLHPLTFHVSRFTFHVSRFTFHVSRFTFHVSRPMLRAKKEFSRHERTEHHKIVSLIFQVEPVGLGTDGPTNAGLGCRASRGRSLRPSR